MDPTDSFTTVIMGYDCRIIMGPARNGKVYGITGLVPDGLPHLEASDMGRVHE